MTLLANFLKNNADMLSAAQRCIDLRQHLPSLVLIYAHIDTLAWASSGKTGTDVRRNFEAWVNKWLIPHLRQTSPEATATDLYAARCGVLHTLTGKSNLSEAGTAREIAYAWGTSTVERLRELLRKADPQGKLIPLHYQHLLQALRDAAADFIASADADEDVAKALCDADARHYVNLNASGPAGNA